MKGANCAAGTTPEPYGRRGFAATLQVKSKTSGTVSGFTSTPPASRCDCHIKGSGHCWRRPLSELLPGSSGLPSYQGYESNHDDPLYILGKSTLTCESSLCRTSLKKTLSYPRGGAGFAILGISSGPKAFHLPTPTHLQPSIGVAIRRKVHHPQSQVDLYVL